MSRDASTSRMSPRRFRDSGHFWQGIAAILLLLLVLSWLLR